MKKLLTAYEVECNVILRKKNLAKATKLGWKRENERGEQDPYGKGQNWYGPDGLWHYFIPNLINAKKEVKPKRVRVFNILVTPEMAVQLQELVKVTQKIDAVDPELEIEGSLRAELNKALKHFPKVS